MYLSFILKGGLVQIASTTSQKPPFLFFLCSIKHTACCFGLSLFCSSSSLPVVSPQCRGLYFEEIDPKSLFLSLSMLQVVFLCLEHTKLIPVTRCLHLSDPRTGMPPLQSITWLLLVQHLCLTSNITSLKRPSLTTYPSPHHFTNYCTFIFLPKTYQHLG